MTQYRASSAEMARPIESVSDLVAYLRTGEKPPERWRVGTEHEKVGLLLPEVAPIPFDGERGIERLLRSIAEQDDWSPIEEGGHVVASEKKGSSLTLEPGGQLELSGAPLANIHETCAEVHEHLAVLKRASEPLGIAWLGLGMHPLHTCAALPFVPKERYAIMREYLPTRGALALEMMQMTATVQANFDFADERDMAEKMRAALSATAVVSAIFANSSLYEGKPSGFVSRRIHIWRATDPDRTGMLPFVFEQDFGYADYVEWALDVPVFFIMRGERLLPLRGKSFRRFMGEGHEGERATLGDFELHLTTLFPEVRLKRYLEVRGADASTSKLTCSLPAIWKGLLYDAEARRAVPELLPWSQALREEALEVVARDGLTGRIGGRSVLELARELTDLAAQGLARIGHRNASGEDERGFLDPVYEQLDRGASPGRVVMEQWEGAWCRSPERLIEYARY